MVEINEPPPASGMHLPQQPMVILCWNRDNPDNFPLDMWQEGRRACLEGDSYVTTWTVGRHRNIPRDALCVLLVQGTKYTRGLCALGVITEEPFEDTHYDDPTRVTNYVEVEWVEMLDLDEVIAVTEVQDVAPGHPWLRGIRDSGHAVDPQYVSDILDLWSAYSPTGQEHGPGEVGPGVYREGSLTTVRVNRYERDRRARQVCLQHHGHGCVACGIDLTAVYGPVMGPRVVHVHHIVPISEMGGTDYVLDPIKDLVPLCPNCHNAIHKTDPVMTPTEFKEWLATRNGSAHS